MKRHFPEDDYEIEMMEELNRKYGGLDFDEERAARQPFFRVILKPLALFVALLFLLTITGRWLQVFTWPSFDLLRQSHQLSGDPFIDELKDAVVQVQVRDDSGAVTRHTRGTGFNISPEGVVLTNRHVVDGAGSITVSFRGLGSYRAVGWSLDDKSDLAAIELNGSNLPAVSLTRNPPVDGEEVIIIGNPRQFTRLVTQGRVTGYYDGLSITGSVVAIDAPIHYGSSGSPVFNQDGRVTAIVFALARGNGEGGMALAIPAARIFKFLEETTG